MSYLFATLLVDDLGDWAFQLQEAVTCKNQAGFSLISIMPITSVGGATSQVLLIFWERKKGPCPLVMAGSTTPKPLDLD